MAKDSSESKSLLSTHPPPHPGERTLAARVSGIRQKEAVGSASPTPVLGHWMESSLPGVALSPQFPNNDNNVKFMDRIL